MADGEKKFTNAGSLKPGSFVLIDGFPCQVKSVEKSKPGKHGSAKARIVAFDVFSGQKRGLLKPTSADAEVPIMVKGSGQVVAVMGEVVQIMDLASYETFDVKKPQGISGLESGVEVEYIKWGDQVKIVRKKGS
jgi:translation initiation factor 5A